MLNLIMMVLEEDVDDALEINSKPAVNSGEALAMLYKLQIFFEKNDVEKSRENKNQLKKTKNCQRFFLGMF